MSHLSECQPSRNLSVLSTLHHPSQLCLKYQMQGHLCLSISESTSLASARCQLAVTGLQGVDRDLLLLYTFYSPRFGPPLPLSQEITVQSLSWGPPCGLDVFVLLLFAFPIFKTHQCLCDRARGETVRSRQAGSHSHFALIFQNFVSYLV